MNIVHTIDDLVTATGQIRRKINRIDELVETASSAARNQHDGAAVDLLGQAKDELEKLKESLK